MGSMPIVIIKVRKWTEQENKKKRKFWWEWNENSWQIVGYKIIFLVYFFSQMFSYVQGVLPSVCLSQIYKQTTEQLKVPYYIPGPEIKVIKLVRARICWNIFCGCLFLTGDLSLWDFINTPSPTFVWTFSPSLQWLTHPPYSPLLGPCVSFLS